MTASNEAAPVVSYAELILSLLRPKAEWFEALSSAASKEAKEHAGKAARYRALIAAVEALPDDPQTRAAVSSAIEEFYLAPRPAPFNEDLDYGAEESRR